MNKADLPVCPRGVSGLLGVTAMASIKYTELRTVNVGGRKENSPGERKSTHPPCAPPRRISPTNRAMRLDKTSAQGGLVLCNNSHSSSCSQPRRCTIFREWMGTTGAEEVTGTPAASRRAWPPLKCSPPIPNLGLSPLTLPRTLTPLTRTCSSERWEWLVASDYIVYHKHVSSV